MRVSLPIPLGFYQSQSAPLSSQRCINWIPTIPQGESLNNRALIQPSGISLFAEGGGICRGGLTMAGVPYFVLGTNLVSISVDGVITTRGAIPGNSRVSIASSGERASLGALLVIVTPDNGDCYVFDDQLNTITKVTNVNYQPSASVVYYRGFYIHAALSGKTVFSSAFGDPFTYSALDEASSDADVDGIVGLVLDHDQLTVLSEASSEVFVYQTGGDLYFPLREIPGAFTQKGSHTKYGSVKFDDTYMFIGGGPNELTAIWRQSTSSQAVKVSTDAIDHAIQEFTKEEIAEAFTMTFAKSGQFFAIFTFNSNRIPGKTFAYNGTASGLSGASIWSELQTGMNDAPWRVNAIIKAYGKLLCGDSLDGRIGVIDGTVYTEYGDSVLREATLKPMEQGGTAIFAGELEVDFESGVGLTTGQGSNPVVMMSFSDDGGRTFSNQFKRSIGKIGEYGHETVWNRQGRFPNTRSIRFSVTDPVKANLIRIAATAELGGQ